MREVPAQSQPVVSEQDSPRSFLNSALFDLNTPLGRRTNAAIMGIVVASVVAAMVSTLPGLPPQVRMVIRQFELAVSVLFMIEYLLRLAVARRRLGYALSFYGLVDLLTWLPLLMWQGNSALRLLRIVRLLKLLRYMGALRMFLRSMRDASELVLVVVGAISIIAIIAGNLAHLVEPETFADAFLGTWWALVTMTTVGYGDLVPHTIFGMTIAALLMLTGIVMFAMLTGTISVKIASMVHQARECSGCNARVRESYHFCPHCGVERDGNS